MRVHGSVIQASFGGPGRPAHAGGVASPIELARRLTGFGGGRGTPIPDPIRRGMETLFRADFSAVQLHVDPAVQALGALAFTRGSEIHFAPGRLDLSTREGRRLLGRELAHVMQQRAGRVRNSVAPGVAVVHDHALEAEAERMGLQAAASYETLIASIQCAKRKRGSSQSGPSKRAKPTPPPVLSARRRGGNANLEGPCGYFRRVRDWTVTHPVQGVIVQEVWRAFQVRQTRGNRVMSAGQLNAYVRDPQSEVHAADTHYWEAWTVTNAGLVSDGGDDTFGLCSIVPGNGTLRNTTKGRFTMRGLARFYPTASNPTALGFTTAAATTVGAAGGLHSTAANPTANLPAPVAGDVDFTVQVDWDSTRSDYYSRVQIL